MGSVVAGLPCSHCPCHIMKKLIWACPRINKTFSTHERLSREDMWDPRHLGYSLEALWDPWLLGSFLEDLWDL